MTSEADMNRHAELYNYEGETDEEEVRVISYQWTERSLKLTQRSLKLTQSSLKGTHRSPKWTHRSLKWIQC
jgi:hypothetical protein